jgi:hypothetical protein
MCSKSKSPFGYALSPLDPSDFSMEKGAFPDEIRGLGLNLKHGSTSSPSNYFNLLLENMILSTSKQNPDKN